MGWWGNRGNRLGFGSASFAPVEPVFLTTDFVVLLVFVDVGFDEVECHGGDGAEWGYDAFGGVEDDGFVDFEFDVGVVVFDGVAPLFAKDKCVVAHRSGDFDVTEEVWVGFCLVVDEGLGLLEELEIGDAIAATIDVVDGAEEDVVASEGEEDGWHLGEAMTAGEDVDLALTATDEEVADTGVGVVLEIGAAVVEDEDAFLELGDAVEGVVGVPDVALDALEGVVVARLEFVDG